MVRVKISDIGVLELYLDYQLIDFPLFLSRTQSLAKILGSVGASYTSRLKYIVARRLNCASREQDPPVQELCAADVATLNA